MNAIVPTQRFPNTDPAAGAPFLSLMLPMAAAVSATAVSLGISTYAGWQRGDLLVERAINVALGDVAVLYVHLLPVCWRVLRFPARMSALGLWSVSLMVVLYGQATFFVVSQQHAGAQRAAAVPATAMLSGADLPSGRALTEIAQDAATVSADLAYAQVRHCTSDCPTLNARRMTLTARLAALKTEADEAKRREAEEDRRNAQAGRNEALRATLRADPVASLVASWVGTTERRLELMLGVACAVVLEGAAVVCWLLVSAGSSRAARCATVTCDSTPVALEHAVTVPGHHIIVGDHMVRADDHAAVTLSRDGSAGDSVVTSAKNEDDLLLERIREAVASGLLKPTQDSIRKFLRCGQPKAGSLNRQYLARFGNARH